MGCDFVTDVVTSPWLAGSRSTGCARQPRGPSRRMAIRPPEWGDRTQCVVGASQGPRSRPFVWGHFSNGHSRRNSHGDNGRRRLCAGHSRVSPGARERWTVGRVVEVAPEPPGALQGSESQGSLGQQPGRQGREKRQPQPGRLLACLSKGKADLSPDSAGTTPPLSPDSVLPAGSAGNECLRSSIVRVKVSCFKNNQICMPQGVSV